jgi:adenylate cyclase
VVNDGLSGAASRDAEQLEQLLLGLGGGADEVRLAIDAGTGGALALDLVLRKGRAPLTLAAAAEQAGAEPAEFARFWQALGFAGGDEAATLVPADLADALPLVAQVIREWLGDDTALGLTRVIGTTSARLAEALVDAFRRDFEVPELIAGASYSQVVESYTTLSRDGLPALEAFASAVLKAHLVRVASGRWMPDTDNRATARDLFVGFVDLVGYTALSRTLSAAELSRLLGGFEETVSDIVTRHNGRVVKLIGDGAMFVADTVADGCAAALEVNAALMQSETLPPARVGADCGAVLSLYGDYFGEVVNRAARLVALANPGTVVVSAGVAGAGGERHVFEQLPEQALKGFQAPAVSYRLRPA